MDRLFAEISLMMTNWKVALGSLGAVGSFIADVASEAAGYENVGTKALLIGAIVYLVRALQQERSDAKAREDKLNATVEANTKALNALQAETEKQTQYFGTVVKTIVDREISKP